MFPVQKKGPAWMRTGKHDITLDPMTDVGIGPLLRGYTKDKEDTAYDLKVRVDQYKHAAEPDKYPKKFVTMFVVDTKKGKVAAPTVEDLMDKLDQQQLQRESHTVDGKLRELIVQNSLYANDKVLELEYLLKKGSLTPEETQRLQTLRSLVARSGPAPTPTGPRLPAGSTMANYVKGLSTTAGAATASGPVNGADAATGAAGGVVTGSGAGTRSTRVPVPTPTNKTNTKRQNRLNPNGGPGGSGLTSVTVSGATKRTQRPNLTATGSGNGSGNKKGALQNYLTKLGSRNGAGSGSAGSGVLRGLNNQGNPVVIGDDVLVKVGEKKQKGGIVTGINQPAKGGATTFTVRYDDKTEEKNIDSARIRRIPDDENNNGSSQGSEKNEEEALLISSAEEAGRQADAKGLKDKARQDFIDEFTRKAFEKKFGRGSGRSIGSAGSDSSDGSASPALSISSAGQALAAKVAAGPVIRPLVPKLKAGPPLPRLNPQPGGKHRTRHRRNRNNKTKRNKSRR
jgi:hypothetical protein